jgi:hypothetical protein
VVLRHAIPEERRGHEIAGVAHVRITSRGADELRDLTVPVLAVQVVLVALKGIGELVMLESVREVEPPPIACVGVQIGEHLVHAAVLRVQHLRDLRVIERREDGLGPRGELRFDGERGAIPGVSIGVAKPGERLVQRVPRRPEAVEVERGRADLALRQRRKRLAAAFERAQVPVAVLVLHGSKLADDVIRPLLVPRVAGREVHETDGREIVAGDMSGEVSPSTVPSGVRFGFLRQPGAHAVVREHAIRLQLEQVFRGEVLGALEGPA